MATTETPSTMTQAEFHASPEYLALTPKEQIWADAFVETQNPRECTRRAYGATSEEYLPMWTRRVENRPSVRDAINAFYRRPERDRFLLELGADMPKLSGVARVRARSLFARVAGLVSEAEPEAPETSPVCVGDFILVAGIKRRVLAINENGRATEVSDEPIV